MKTLLAERLASTRKALGLGQREMANALGISSRTWQIYEAGGSVPGGNVFEGLTKLGVNANWLFTGEGEIFRDIILDEEKAHEALRERLRDKRYRNSWQFDETCSFHDISKALAVDYINGDYIRPTMKELTSLCKIAGRWDFERGKVSTKDTSVVEVQYIEEIKVELLERIIEETEGLIKEKDISINIKKKAIMITMIYENLKNMDVEIADLIVKEKIRNHLRLVV